VGYTRLIQTMWDIQGLYKLCGIYKAYTNYVGYTRLIQTMWDIQGLYKLCVL
jgi:hypothetical protein